VKQPPEIRKDMDIKMKASEIWGFLSGRKKEDNENNESFSLIGGGFHLHFHISINPTFHEKEKKEDG